MKDTVELFFAFDDNYAPSAAVTMLSLKENRNKNRSYNLHILHTGMGVRTMSRLSSELCEESFSLSFHDISEAADELSERLHTRDYYSKCTYYRLFIPRLFPDIKKALYLDCDLIFRGDVSELYDLDVSGKLVGAVVDGAVTAVPEFREYASERLGIDPSRYFNAGVLLMNLEQMRRMDFEEVFRRIISKVKFDVAQDQDYLNVICNGKVEYIDECWNRMPIRPEEAGERVELIHFNLDKKPWLCDGVPFAEDFMKYARISKWQGEIDEIRRSFTEKDRAASLATTERLIMTAHAEACDFAECERIRKTVCDIVCAKCGAV